MSLQLAPPNTDVSHRVPMKSIGSIFPPARLEKPVSIANLISSSFVTPRAFRAVRNNSDAADDFLIIKLLVFNNYI